MALIKFGGGIVQMAGSIAGTTFARNRYGNYARARTKPTNPNTAGQVAVRAALSALTVRWSTTLTANQRTAWNLYGSNVVMQNRLGEAMNLSGFNHFIRSNLTAQRIGSNIADDGPVIFELPEADPLFSITASEATQDITYTFDNTLAWANEDDGWFIVYNGSPQTAQRNFFAGPWRFLTIAPGALAAPPVSPKDVAATYAIAETQHLWCYARIRRADGRLSEPFRGDIAVGA